MSSGTVGAALEGALAGKKGVALSFPFFNGWENWNQEDIDSAIQVRVFCSLMFSLSHVNLTL